MRFKSGDIVYHRTLREQGIFDEYDQWDTDTAYVIFIDNYGYGDCARVSHCLLSLIKEDSNGN